MSDKNIKLVVKYLIVIGIIFCALSIFFPWYEVGNDSGNQFTFYSWGINSNYYISDTGFSTYFEFLNYNKVVSFIGITIEEINPVTLILGMLVIIFVLSSLYLSIVSLKDHIKGYNFSNLLWCGFFGIISVIAFYLFVNFLIIKINLNNFNYSFGLYFMIISSILFFTSYIILYEFFDEDIKIRQLEQEALEILNKRYVKGEISKKEYIDKKKDILE